MCVCVYVCVCVCVVLLVDLKNKKNIYLFFFVVRPFACIRIYIWLFNFLGFLFLLIIFFLLCASTLDFLQCCERSSGTFLKFISSCLTTFK